MGKRLARTVLVMAMFVCIAGIAKGVTDNRGAAGILDTENLDSEEKKDEIILTSLIISPETTTARLTAKIITDKPEPLANDYNQHLVIGTQSMYPMEGGYEVVWRGIFDVSVDELEKMEAFYYGDKEVDASRIKKDQMEITIVGVKHFEATDGNGLTFPVDISRIGGCIAPTEEWQKDSRRAYVVADLKDGTSCLVARLPAVNPFGKKKYRVEDPEEIKEIEAGEEQEGKDFVCMASGIQTENCGLIFETENDIEVEKIQSMRLIVQELE